MVAADSVPLSVITCHVDDDVRVFSVLTVIGHQNRFLEVQFSIQKPKLRVKTAGDIFELFQSGWCFLPGLPTSVQFN
jgi:hypothetical protein